MSKIKNKNDVNTGGRPTSYKEEFADQAFNYCLLGATDKDLAQFFEVAESTINKWKKDYPEFSESIKKGKVQADAVIASSLYNRAKGAIINQQQAFKIKSVTYNDKGQRTEIESVEIVDLQQEQPPDTTAGIFWLKNRNPKHWRDKTETENMTTIKASFAINKMKTDKDEFANNESDIN